MASQKTLSCARKSVRLPGFNYVFAAILSVACCKAACADDAEKFFETKIRPVLIEKCLKCHGETKQEGSLRLDSYDAFLEGGDSGPALDIESLDASLLLEAIKYESYEMPPNEQLGSEIIKDFEAWVAHGAAWPKSSEHLRASKTTISDEDRQWWAFLPLQDVSPPEVALPDEFATDWSHNPIDQFVAAKLQERSMFPAPQADRVTLARRLYFDLIGMPPTPEELHRFLDDTSPDAYERLVDRLLDDARYGEHWARFWLDLVRYAESDGWNQDAYRPHIWRYRDYVVDSFNSDKPYTEFVREQLAGDELDADKPDHLVATGFLRLGIYEYNQRDARGHWNDIMNEMTDVAGDVFLGLSMACARCHDHKFDPILQEDYFRLRAFFEPISWRDDLVAATEAEKQAYTEDLAEWESATADIREKIEKLTEPYNAKKWKSTVDKFPLDIQACFHMPVEERTSWQNQMAYLVSRQFLEEGGGPLKSMSKEDKKAYDALQEQLAEHEHLKPQPLPQVMAATDFAGLSSPTFIQDDPTRRSIEPSYLTVLSDREDLGLSAPQSLPITFSETAIQQTRSSGRRTALAKWLTDAKNPITTRVMVNRIWQQHFGQGIVETPSDFGTQGQLPSHPELLDWLTHRFIEDGWRIKPLHKQIVMSATWRQSATHPQADEFAKRDPAEQLLWRAPVRRLQAEQIRDAMLIASGELSAEIGGPSVDEKTPRRGLYVKSFRNKNDSFLHGFDMANGLKSVAIRDNTTTPTQALLMINGEYAMMRAKAMARRILESAVDNEDAIRRAFWLVWNREPGEEDFVRASDFVSLESGEGATAPLAEDTLASLCHVLLNTNQFLYVD